jgi:hypothetical protein
MPGLSKVSMIFAYVSLALSVLPLHLSNFGV